MPVGIPPRPIPAIIQPATPDARPRLPYLVLSENSVSVKPACQPDHFHQASGINRPPPGPFSFLTAAQKSEAQAVFSVLGSAHPFLYKALLGRPFLVNQQDPYGQTFLHHLSSLASLILSAKLVETYRQASPEHSKMSPSEIRRDLMVNCLRDQLERECIVQGDRPFCAFTALVYALPASEFARIVVGLAGPGKVSLRGGGELHLQDFDLTEHRGDCRNICDRIIEAAVAARGRPLHLGAGEVVLQNDGTPCTGASEEEFLARIYELYGERYTFCGPSVMQDMNDGGLTSTPVWLELRVNGPIPARGHTVNFINIETVDGRSRVIFRDPNGPSLSEDGTFNLAYGAFVEDKRAGVYAMPLEMASMMDLRFVVPRSWVGPP